MKGVRKGGKRRKVNWRAGKRTREEALSVAIVGYFGAIAPIDVEWAVPRKTEWIHRIPEALQILEQLSPVPPLIDRRDIERLLHVSPRQALRILARLGAAEVGKNLFLERDEFLRRLRALHAGEDATYERRRLCRLNDALEALERDLKAHRVPIHAKPDTYDLLLPALPSSVRLRPGRLEVDFSTPEELLARLFELSQAIANDYDTFTQAVATPAGTGPMNG